MTGVQLNTADAGWAIVTEMIAIRYLITSSDSPQPSMALGILAPNGSRAIAWQSTDVGIGVARASLRRARFVRVVSLARDAIALVDSSAAHFVCPGTDVGECRSERESSWK